MTEKRFTYKHFDWLQWHIYDNGEYLVEASGNEEEDIKPLVDLLNSLNDENRQLKQKNKELEEELDCIWDSHENYYGMSIRNTEWYGFKGDGDD